MDKTEVKHFSSIRFFDILNWRKWRTLFVIFYRKWHITRMIIITIWDKFFSLQTNDPILFVDCGANVGQSFDWFKKYFNRNNISFVLFEPNPNCIKILKKKLAHSEVQASLISSAVGLQDGKTKFYGIEQDELSLSQGGAIHPAPWHKHNDERYTTVDIIDLPKFLKKKKTKTTQIVMKMDIEGAEVKLLESMIKDDTIRLLDILYVEFHSRFFPKAERSKLALREQNIFQSISQKGVKIRTWH